MSVKSSVAKTRSGSAGSHAPASRPGQKLSRYLKGFALIDRPERRIPGCQLDEPGAGIRSAT